MTQLFSSPGKQATQAASASEAISQQAIDQQENVAKQQQQDERTAIAGVGANPYFTAAAAQKPTQVDPTKTATFSTPGPSGTQGPPQLAPLNTFSSVPPGAATPPINNTQRQAL